MSNKSEEIEMIKLKIVSMCVCHLSSQINSTKPIFHVEQTEEEEECFQTEIAHSIQTWYWIGLSIYSQM